jgi:FixJ family two-component response regulator
MSSTDPVVYVLNGDPQIRNGLCELIRSAHLDEISFGSAGEYLCLPKRDVPGCVILDVDLPDMCGLELQRQIAATDAPVLFVTGRSDIGCSVRAIKSGALDFLTIPFETTELLQAIRAAIVHDGNTRAQRAAETELRRRYSSLTTRERQVMHLVASGLRNKQSAWELGISEFTLQIHRAQVMQKMRAPSIAHLVRMADALDVPHWALHEPTKNHLLRGLEAVGSTIEKAFDPSCRTPFDQHARHQGAGQHRKIWLALATGQSLECNRAAGLQPQIIP